MGAFVEYITFLGERAIRATNDHLSFMIVPAWGSNLISLIDRRTGTAVLRVPDSAEQFRRDPILYGTPILFPPNRIEDGRFSYRGRDYRFDVNEPKRGNHIHGFVYNRPWNVVRAEVDDARRAVVVTQFDAADYEAVVRQFPHKFIIRMRYSLVGNCVHKIAQVFNNGPEPFPVGLGFHTCFRFPEETARFALTAEKRWRLNDRMLPTGELEDIPYKKELRKGMSLERFALDDAFLSNAGAASVKGDKADSLGQAGVPNEATLYIPSADVKISYRAGSDFKHWVVYNGDGRAGFICVEPYTWVTNAPNLDLPAALTGFQELRAGESKTFETSIMISKVDS